MRSRQVNEKICSSEAWSCNLFQLTLSVEPIRNLLSQSHCYNKLWLMCQVVQRRLPCESWCVDVSSLTSTHLATYCSMDDEALLMNSVGSHKEHLSSHEDTHPPPKYYSQSAALSLWRPTLTDRHEGEVQSDGPLWSSKSAGITRVCQWVCVCYWPVSPTLDPFIWSFEAMNARFRGFLHFTGNLESKIKCWQRQREKVLAGRCCTSAKHN